jgi:SAM-dependent methyltransferase
MADMRDGDTIPGGDYDVVVLGYSLHHVDDVPMMLDVARRCLRPGGTLLVLDVCDASAAFHEAVSYQSLDSVLMAACGLVRLDHGLTWHPMPAEVVGGYVHALLVAGEARPGMWLGSA